MKSPVFCDNCRSLYPADGLNHFELLGLEPAFDIDPALVRRRYLRTSRGVHPDHQGTAESSASLRISAQLNEAHRVLSNPVLRAEYLLELFGGKSAATDRAVPPEVLSTTLMLREGLAEAQANGDEAALRECTDQARARHEAALTQVRGLAVRLPADEQTQTDLRLALNSIKYYQKLLRDL